MSRIGSRRTRLALVLITAGVTGAGVLTGAAPANAATVNWDKIAQCESGGRWHINTGNGYYGGLQFSRSTWKSNGGGKYAATANKASKSEQIAIAQKLYKKRGLSPWPVCGKKAGVYKKTTTKVTARKTATKTTVKATGKTYVVRSGDTLASIAKKFKVKGGWRTLYRLNDDRLKSPSLIFTGQRIRL